MSDGKAPGVGVMLGGGVELHALGKVWKVSAPDQNAKGRLEKIAAAHAIQAVRRLKSYLDADAYKEAFAEVTTGVENYATWRPGWQTVVFGNPHLFLWSLLLANHEGLSEDTVLRIFAESPEEVAAAYAQVMPDFFDLLLAPVRGEIPPDMLAKYKAACAETTGRLSALAKRTPPDST